MTPNAAMMFAAGLGTRMRPLTLTRPKPLIEVGSTTLLDHALDLAGEAGVERLVVNTHYLGEMVRNHVSDRNVAISDETETLLDTGGGLKAALPLLGEGPVFTMNTDAIWLGPNPFDVLRQAWNPDKMGALLLVVPQQQALGHKGKGDFLVDPDGRLTRGPGPIYGGAQILWTDGLAEIQDDVFSLNQLWSAMAEDGRLFGVSYPGRWCDVGRPESLPVAAGLLAQAEAI